MPLWEARLMVDAGERVHFRCNSAIWQTYDHTTRVCHCVSLPPQMSLTCTTRNPEQIFTECKFKKLYSNEHNLTSSLLTGYLALHTLLHCGFDTDAEILHRWCSPSSVKFWVFFIASTRSCSHLSARVPLWQWECWHLESALYLRVPLHIVHPHLHSWTYTAIPRLSWIPSLTRSQQPSNITSFTKAGFISEGLYWIAFDFTCVPNKLC